MSNSVEYNSFIGFWKLIAPSWLQGIWGTKLITAFGNQQDTNFAYFKDAVKCRFTTQAPTDALELIGADRTMPKHLPVTGAKTETYAAYATRVQNAWVHWLEGGTDKGLLKALSWVGFVDCSDTSIYPTYDPQDPSFVPDPTQPVIVASAYDLGAGGRPDAPSTDWSVFWVYADAAANSITLDLHTWDEADANWDVWDGVGVWDLEETEAMVASWKETIRTWKPLHAKCPYIIFRGSSDWADVWGPFGAWGDADEGVWGGSMSDVVFCSVGEG